MRAGWMAGARATCCDLQPAVYVGNHGCSNTQHNRQEHEARSNCPLGPVVGSSRCSRLASAPPWEVVRWEHHHHPPLIR
jgi:hypothetical protein